MEAVYPSAASALARGRRARRADPRSRHRTVPVTFAEIKEVDEENEEACAGASAGAGAGAGAGGAGEERRRRPDVLDERLQRQFAEFRRRREFRRKDVLRERDPDEASASAPASAPASVSRAGSEPAALNCDADT